MKATNGDEENLWSKILDDVQSKSSNSMPQASILILGDNDAGKTSLVAKLQRVDDPKKGSGLEYHYLEVNPDLKDGLFAYQLGSALPDVVPGESARLGVWVLDGDVGHAALLKHALPPPPTSAGGNATAPALDRHLLLLCASMGEPGALMEALQRWARCLERHMTSVDGGFDKRAMAEGREKQIRFWQEYLEPLDSSSHSDMGAKVPSMETDHFLLPLSDSILTHNIGLPIVVVITKCDAMSTLEKDYDFKDEHFDFMQQHVRKFCLEYGAALVYTSAKDSRNVDVLYKYILHRVYGFPFTQPASVVEKDSIFIPAGWDNEKKIAILHENMTSLKPDDPFGDHIKKPSLKRPQQREMEIQAENDQNFLGRQLNIMNTQTPPQPQAISMAHRQENASSLSPSLPQRSKSTLTSTPLSATNLNSLNNSMMSTTPSNVGANGGSPLIKKPDSVKTTPLAAGTSQEGVLAQFFNNLLSKKTSGVTSPNTGAMGVNLPGGAKPMDKMNLSNDATEAELERILANNGRAKSIDENMTKLQQQIPTITTNSANNNGDSVEE